MYKTFEKVKKWFAGSVSQETQKFQGYQDDWSIKRGGYNFDLNKRTRRNIDAILGYKETPTYDDYAAEYARNPIAAAIINRPVKDSWISWPSVYESDEKETNFEKAWQKILDRMPVWSKLARLDKLACLGQYAVLIIGTTRSGIDFSKPPGIGGELVYLNVIDQPNATIQTTDSDPTSLRYGLPVLYRITLTSYEGGVTTTATYNVHWQRVIHVAEGAVTNDLLGTPRLESVYNRLISSEIVGGGAAEMFFRGAYPGIAVKSTSESRLGSDDVSVLQERLASFANNLNRYILLEGMELSAISPQVTSPLQHDDVLIRHISAASDIPQRILLGSERGQLASAQDERAWASNIEARRQQYLIPYIIRPLIDRLIELKVLPVPQDNYFVQWTPFGQMSPAEQADVGLRHTNALVTYVSTPGAEDLMPPELFLKRELGMSDGEIELAVKATRDIQETEEIDSSKILPDKTS